MSPENPFGRPQPRGDRPSDAHPSDDPGTGHTVDGSRKTKGKNPSSGVGPHSQPRRTMGNERQAPRRRSTERVGAYEAIIPGEVLHGDEPVEINVGAVATTLRVANTADRPVQIGSHFHFAEVNAALDFDREAAWGKRLNVLSGASVRFEPGAVEEVELIPINGRREVLGLRGLCGGQLDDAHPTF